MDQNSIYQAAEDLKREIREKMSSGSLEDSCFLSWSGLCTVLTAYLREQGRPGWSEAIGSEVGPAFDSKQRDQIETAFAQAPWLLEILQMNPPAVQKGGAGPEGTPVGRGPMLPKVPTAFVQDISPTSFDISLDRGFEQFLKKTQQAEEFMDQFREETPGIAKLIRTDIPIGAVPVPLQAIVSLFFTLIDAIRLSAAAYGSKTIPLLLLSLLKEFILGEWRQMILTSLGFFSPSGVSIGILAKYVVNAWLFASAPDRNEILKALFKGYKSALTGFFLWASVTFTPNLFKIGVESALERIRLMVENLEEQKQTLEAAGSQALAPFGKKLVFPNFDVNAIKRLSLADVQSIQSLAEWKPMMCSREFRAVIDPLVANPGLRLVLEMFNIPTSQEAVLEVCPCGPKPIGETVKTMLQTAVVDDGMPEAPSFEAPLVAAVQEQPPPVQEVPTQPAQSGGRRGLNRHTRKAVKKLQKVRRKTPKARRLA